MKIAPRPVISLLYDPWTHNMLDASFNAFLVSGAVVNVTFFDAWSIALILKPLFTIVPVEDMISTTIPSIKFLVPSTVTKLVSLSEIVASLPVPSP